MTASAKVARLPVTQSDDAPELDLRITGVIREGSNEITPSADCEQLFVGDTLIGSYVATDRRCRVRLHVGTTPPASSRPSPVWPAIGSPRAPDGTWELHTANMQPSSYTLTLRTVDRALAGDSTPCCGSVALDFRLEPRAAPSPRSAAREWAWKLTSHHDPSATQ